MKMTLAQKILARASNQSFVEAGQFVTASVDRMMVNDNIALIAQKFKQAGIPKMHDPDRVVVVFDHVFPATTVNHAEIIATGTAFMDELDIKHYLGAPGIAHQVMCERGFVLPGQLVLGTDSHSTMYGALGGAGAGIGITEMTYLLATGELWMQVPETVRFELTGKLPKMVTSKDVVLHLIGRFGGDYCQYKAIEYGGEAVAAMSLSQRMTIANMGAEFGAKFAMFEADQKTLDYLVQTPQVKEETPDLQAFYADEGAEYSAHHTIDVSDLEPQVACPHSPDNVKDISAVGGKKIHQAYLGSCTNARLEDIELAAELLKDNKIAKGTRLLVVPASQQVLLDATKAGHVETLLQAGAHVLASGCGACAGIHSGLLADNEVCISSTNRNFPGRMGSTKSELYLSSPAVVVASAIRGEITDPRDITQ